MSATKVEAETNMGTGKEWLLVVLRAGVWAGAMALWPVMAHRNGLRTKERILSVVLLLTAALFYGIFATFLGRIIRPPLVFVAGPVLAGMFLTGWLFRREKEVEKDLN